MVWYTVSLYGGLQIAITGNQAPPRSGFTRELLDEITARVDFAELVSRYVVLKPAGEGRFMGRCPFHNDKTPSFSVNASKGLYHCFGCGAGGDLIDFVMAMENLTFPEAVRELAARVGMEIPRASEPPDPRWQVLRLAQEFYHSRLLGAPANHPARLYLKKRDVGEDEIKHWGLGFSSANWDDLLVYMRGKGYDEKVLADTGLIVTDATKGRAWDKFRERLMFPIRSGSGALLGFGGRALGDAQPKYLNSPETRFFHKKELLFGLDKAFKEIASKGYALIVEGYFDVMAMHREGVTQTVAPMGTAFSPEQARLLRRFTDKVKLLYDPDEAGRKAQERSVEILWEEGLEAKIAMLPEDSDPDDMVREQGRKGIAAVLTGGITPVEYFLNPAKMDITTRREYGKRLEAMLSKIPDTVYREALFDEYSRLVGVPKEMIRVRQDVYRGDGGATGTSRPAGKLESDPAEMLLCYLAAYDVRFAGDMAIFLGEEEVNSSLLRTILHHLIEKQKTGELVYDELMEEWERLGIKSRLATLANDPKLRLKEGSDPYETLLEVKNRALKKKIDEIHDNMDIGSTEQNDDNERLLSSVINLTKMLNEIRLSRSERISARQAMENILMLMQNGD
jgi:DNA primase